MDNCRINELQFYVVSNLKANYCLNKRFSLIIYNRFVDLLIVDDYGLTVLLLNDENEAVSNFLQFASKCHGMVKTQHDFEKLECYKMGI